MSPKHLSRECPGDLALPPQSPGVGVAFNVTLVRGISLYGPWSTMLWPQDKPAALRWLLVRNPDSH